MILRHILSQFTKFVLKDLKYSQDMTRCHSNYDVRLWLWNDTDTRTHFTRSFRCLPAPVPRFDQAHSTSTIWP